MGPVATEAAQAAAALFAFQVGATRMWRSWGLEPAVVMGHGTGEVGAAWAAGVMSVEQAARFVVERGQLLHEAPAGKMVALRVAEASRWRPSVRARTWAWPR